jgi:hypothetical protein
MKLFHLILLIIILANSCKKKVTKVDENFIGLWRTQLSTNEAALKITADSQGEFESWSNLSDEGGESFHGVARCKGNKLKIGSLNTLTIVEYPHLIDTTQFFWNRSGPKPNWKIVIHASRWRTINENLALYTLK